MTDQTYSLAVALRHELHRKAELSCEEVETRRYLMEYLRAHTSTLELVDRGLWFYAVYRGSPEGRKIAFRADMDALPIPETISLPYGSENPGVSHKCGHDGHCATLCALALETDRRGSENTIYFIFQHAEEIGVGAKECAVLIDEEKIDEVYGYHNESGYPAGDVIVRDGALQCASVGMSLYFKGQTSHASDPGIGRNPGPAISRIVLALPALYRPEDYEGFVLATLIQIAVGEEAFGTSPGDGVLRLTIRGQYEREMLRLRDRINTLAHSLAIEYGLGFRVEYRDYFPENVNHNECNDRVRKICAELKIPVHEFPFPKSGSEDFGYFTKRTKGCFFNVGLGSEGSAHHTVSYDFNDEIMKNACLVFERLAELPEGGEKHEGI